MRKSVRKRIILIAMCMMLALTFTGLQAQRMINVTLNGNPITLAQTPIMSNGRVLVPMRGVFENMGAQVNYNPADRTIMATRGASTVQLTVGSTQAFVNGQAETLDVAPQIYGSSVYIPLRFVGEALQADVSWSEYDSTVSIRTMGGGYSLNNSGYGTMTQPTYTTAQPTYESSQPAYETSSFVYLDLLGPAPAQYLPSYFDVTGQTDPYSTVSFQLYGNNREIMNVQVTANSAGSFTIPVDLSRVGSGTHIVTYLQATSSTGALSRQLRVEYTKA